MARLLKTWQATRVESGGLDVTGPVLQRAGFWRVKFGGGRRIYVHTSGANLRWGSYAVKWPLGEIEATFGKDSVRVAFVVAAITDTTIRLHMESDYANALAGLPGYFTRPVTVNFVWRPLPPDLPWATYAPVKVEDALDPAYGFGSGRDITSSVLCPTPDAFPPCQINRLRLAFRPDGTFRYTADLSYDENVRRPDIAIEGEVVAYDPAEKHIVLTNLILDYFGQPRPDVWLTPYSVQADGRITVALPAGISGDWLLGRLSGNFYGYIGGQVRLTLAPVMPE